MNKLLVIGTGAISQVVYLPLLSRAPKWKPFVCCVDSNVQLLDAAARTHGLAVGGTDYAPLLQDAEVAIIATPPRTHFPIARACLEAGLHVILEKPLTDTHEQAVALVQLASEQKRLLMVNNTRRLFPAYQEIRRILQSGRLGRLIQLDYSEGGTFAWPTTSGFYFDSTNGGRGVIADRGSHVLDLICWWTGAVPAVAECRTDRDGGVEGYSDVRLTLPDGGARVRLSWHNKLSNRLRITCERGEITAGIYDFRELIVTCDGRTQLHRMPSREREFADYAMTFARRALMAALDGGPPPINGADVLASLELIDQCYLLESRLDFPWLYKHSRRD